MKMLFVGYIRMNFNNLECIGEINIKISIIYIVFYLYYEFNF